MEIIPYKRLSGFATKIFIGYTVSDCQLIDHFLGHAGVGDWHEGMFFDTSLYKLKKIAKLHNCELKEIGDE